MIARQKGHRLFCERGTNQIYRDGPKIRLFQEFISYHPRTDIVAVIAEAALYVVSSEHVA